MDELGEHLYLQAPDLLNADVSVLFYDTTSVSFQLPAPDEEGSLRQLGHLKKKRGDLPHLVLGLAINRDGLSVRHWVFPGNTVDFNPVKKDGREGMPRLTSQHSASLGILTLNRQMLSHPAMDLRSPE